MRMLATCCVLVAALPAFAHIKLETPASFQMTDSLGNPQKSAPCGGAGTATGVITTVTAGQQLTVTWDETIAHPGHFRIGIARMASDFVTPAAVVQQNDCKSAAIESNPAYPTLIDGLFPHASGSGTRTTTITVPMMSCDNCVLQLLQFMSSHSPPCFYYQCATLKIVMPAIDAGVGDAGVSDGGENRPANDAGQMNPTDAGSMTMTDGGQVNQPDAGLTMEDPTIGGCGCSSAPLGLVLLLPLAWRRRRSS